MDQLLGSRPRCLTLVDDFTRQCLAIHVDTSSGGSTVADLLASLIEQRGRPAIITTDNGPEFICRALHHWAQASSVTLNHKYCDHLPLYRQESEHARAAGDAVCEPEKEELRVFGNALLAELYRAPT